MKQKTVHTVESLLARTEEEGECLLWTGWMAGKSAPYVYDGEKMVSVRKMICHLQGRELTGDYFGCSCGNDRCINPEHITQRSKTNHLRRMAKRGQSLAVLPTGCGQRWAARGNETTRATASGIRVTIEDASC